MNARVRFNIIKANFIKVWIFEIRVHELLRERERERERANKRRVVLEGKERVKREF